MDETQDNKPHPHVHADANAPLAVPPGRGESLSIWFFCGILTLGYGIVLIAQALLEHFRLFNQHPPATVLANLHPTFWWGLLMFLFGAFYTLRFRPGKA
jgi:hypothetical protein